MLPGLCSDAELGEIVAYFRNAPVILSDGSLVSLDTVPTGTTIVPYRMSTVLACPGLLALVNHPTVLSVAAGYLGCMPTLSSLGVRWSLPGVESTSPVQRFHRDPDDWRFLKTFIYLTDVDDGSGPHVYVRGSHRRSGRIRARPYDRASIARDYGEDSIDEVLGSRGTAFMADTFGIHAGPVPKSRPRLLLQAQYSLLPVYAFEYSPIEWDAPDDLDPYVNRLLIRKRRSHPQAASSEPARAEAPAAYLK
ncbi:MAG TPA: hypothetical protein VHS58_17555 [Acetobacteraceae bacterium]|nr:hypothetical protein [Acetobacteraceae bacterium]